MFARNGGAARTHHLPTSFPPPALPVSTRPFAPDIYGRGDGLNFWFEQVTANYFASHRHAQSQVALGFGVRGCELGWQENGGRPEERQAGGDVVWFLPRDAEHTVRLRRSAFWIVFYFDPGLDIARDVAVRATLAPLGDYVRRDSLIGDLSAALRRERATGTVEDPAHVVNLGSLLGSCLLRAHARERQKPRAVIPLQKEVKERVRHFVVGHLHEKLTLADLAKMAGMAPDHFSRRLKASTGLTAEQFILRLRLDHAQSLLRTGRYSVEEVAGKCGFKNHASLTKQFSIRFGRPPRSFLPPHGSQ
ncbi:MAG: AraC family transcriptional regulator [Candidatus Didemnitutus sp.]|nr:AraC family transcriptional regulator [Candidatus Didemnitutus sp.]